MVKLDQRWRRLPSLELCRTYADAVHRAPDLACESCGRGYAITLRRRGMGNETDRGNA